MICTDAVPYFVGSATEVAFTVTVEGEGTAEGATKWPVLLIVPQALPEQPVPDTLHVTAVFEVASTSAVNCFFPVIATMDVAGETVTLIGISVTIIDPDFVGSATEVAIIVAVV